MQIWLADPLFGGAVQGGRHLFELFAAFGLTTLIGLERTVQGKSAGLRTQTIVGTSSALILLISKYGFGDVRRQALSCSTLHASRLKPSPVSAFWARGSLSLDAVPSTGSPRLVERQLTARLRGTVRLHIIYQNGRGVLRQLLRICGQRNWQLAELDADAHDIDSGEVGVTMTLSGANIANATQVFTEVDGVSAVLRAEDEPD